MSHRVSASAFALGAAFAVASVLPAGAASDGTIGGTSSGSLLVSLTVPQLVRISSLDDIDLGTFSGAGDVTGRDDVCVWSTTRGYRVTASGSGTAGAFQLTGASPTDVIPYQVQWADAAGETSGAALSTGAALNAQSAATSSPTCGGGSALNASVIVVIAETDMTAATASAYSGTLSLLVEPQ